MLANGPIITHIIKQGGDDRRLGRWRWFVCRGKQERKTCLIGCYRPGATWDALANQAVALQRKRKAEDSVHDPITLWIDDMTVLIQERQREGCEITLTGDFNEDLQDSDSPINVMARQLGLREALLEHYPVGQGFSTYVVTRGSTVIDGVFFSQGLRMEKGGIHLRMNPPVTIDGCGSIYLWTILLGEHWQIGHDPLNEKQLQRFPLLKNALTLFLMSR